MTKIKLELIPDLKVQEIFYISNKYRKPNNKYLTFYDPKQLYCYALPKFIPASGFKWIDPKELNLNKCNSNISKRCVLKDDLEFSKELTELHNHYPLAPEKIEIKREMLC